jgi:hypothetical protein
LAESKVTDRLHRASAELEHVVANLETRGGIAFGRRCAIDELEPVLHRVLVLVRVAETLIENDVGELEPVLHHALELLRFANTLIPKAAGPHLDA